MCVALSDCLFDFERPLWSGSSGGNGVDSAISQAGVVGASRPENLPFAPSSHSSSKRTFAHLLENVSLKMSYSPTYALLCMENEPITV